LQGSNRLETDDGRLDQGYNYQYSPIDPRRDAENNELEAAIRNDRCAFSRFDSYTVSMNDFNRKVEDASARVNKSVAEATERIEKETVEFIAYLNDEVVPAVRQHSTKALRVAAEKMSRLADYLDEIKPPRP
jgi:hypothetical protein